MKKFKAVLWVFWASALLVAPAAFSAESVEGLVKAFDAAPANAATTAVRAYTQGNDGPGKILQAAVMARVDVCSVARSLSQAGAADPVVVSQVDACRGMNPEGGGENAPDTIGTIGGGGTSGGTGGGFASGS